MGNRENRKLLILAVLFLCACVAVYWPGETEPNKKKPLLKDFIRQIEGYTLLRNIELAENTAIMLDIDDNFYADFVGTIGLVNLYIGYYYSAEKAYASHSPTVCYPSQGWKVDTIPASGTLTIGPDKVSYVEFTASLGRQKEVVIYWYQARLLTNTHAYKNKIDMGYNMLVHNDDTHGFVRVAVPFFPPNHDQAKKAALDFIKSFYPLFESYLTD